MNEVFFFLIKINFSRQALCNKLKIALTTTDMLSTQSLHEKIFFFQLKDVMQKTIARNKIE